MSLPEWDRACRSKRERYRQRRRESFGDNDHLAAMVNQLLQATMLIVLTKWTALMPAIPRTSAQLIHDCADGSTGRCAGSPGRRKESSAPGPWAASESGRLVTPPWSRCQSSPNGAAPTSSTDLRRRGGARCSCRTEGRCPARKTRIGTTASARQLVPDAGAREAVPAEGQRACSARRLQNPRRLRQGRRWSP